MRRAGAWMMSTYLELLEFKASYLGLKIMEKCTAELTKLKACTPKLLRLKRIFSVVILVKVHSA